MKNLILATVVIGLGFIISRFVKYIGPFISTVYTIVLLGMFLEPKMIPDIPARFVVSIAILIAGAVVGRLTFALGEWLICINERMATKMQSSIESAELQTPPKQF